MWPSGFYSCYLRETSCWNTARGTCTFTLKVWPRSPRQPAHEAGEWVAHEQMGKLRVTCSQPEASVGTSKASFALQARLPAIKINEVALVKGLEVVRTKRPPKHLRPFLASSAWGLNTHANRSPGKARHSVTVSRKERISNLPSNCPTMDPVGFLF